MVVMINSGLRKGELKQLKWSDLERNPVLKGEDALVDDFGNNPPPEIGTQSYSGDTHDKGD